jgi:hypothetical protein
MESLDAGAVELDVVGGPADTELLAARGQLADQVGQCAVVGVASGLGAKEGHDVVGDPLPLDVVLGRARVQKDDAAALAADRVAEDLGEERGPELVGMQDVQAPVLHQRRRPGHRVEDPLHARAYALPSRTTYPAGRVGDTHKSIRCARSASSSWSAALLATVLEGA